MKYKPHEYQSQAIDFLIHHPQAALFLDMGLGKTSITLTALEELALDRFEITRALIIAPLRVARDTWPAEIEKWDHLAQLDYAVAIGTPAERVAALSQDATVTLINRENVPWLVKHFGRGWPYDAVIIDESSSFKSHQSQRFKALKAVRPRIKRIVALTGTPAPNSLLDLWAPFRLLDEGKRLGKYITHYRDAFFDPDKRNGLQVYSWKPKAQAEEEIYHRIGDITLSMQKADYLKVPAVTRIDVPVALTASEKASYERLKADLVLTLPEGAIIDAQNAAVLSGKLLQLASGCVYGEDGEAIQIHDRKLDALEDLIEAASGQSVLVAYWFKADLERIRKRIPAARELKTSADFAAWNAGEIPVALIHPASAGHGLNLQSGGHHLVWFTPCWSLELYQQTNARLDRQGQEHPVTIHHILTTGTVDTQVMRALERKDTTQTALIDAVKSQLTPYPYM